MTPRRPAWAAALCLLALAGASPAEPSAGGCGDSADSADDDAVCALQQGSLKKEAPPSKPAPVAVQVDANRHTHQEAVSTKATSAHAEKAEITKKAKETRQSDQTDKQAFPWDNNQAADVVEQGGFGVIDGESLNYAEEYLDKLPSKSAFDAQVGWTGLPLTMAFVNDKTIPVTWEALEELDGHIFDEPEVGSQINPGEVATVQMYAASDGLKGKARLRDSHGKPLSVAWQSYRVGSLSCDRLRVRAMKTAKWDEPAEAMCTTNEAGIYRRNDYEVIVSLKRAK